MTPFIYALSFTVVPAVLWMFTISQAAALPRGSNVPRRIAVARFLLPNWPFMLIPAAAPVALYRLAQMDLPTQSWLNLAVMVLGPIIFTCAIIRPWSRQR
ncbi:hypothetical protein [Pseudomonas sp.]|uniref:hypothetical protein n=1 Tax=Pseudomonas sp. TaxID=306 RepID=UPI003D0E4E07